MESEKKNSAMKSMLAKAKISLKEKLDGMDKMSSQNKELQKQLDSLNIQITELQGQLAATQTPRKFSHPFFISLQG